MQTPFVCASCPVAGPETRRDHGRNRNRRSLLHIHGFRIRGHTPLPSVR